MREGVIDSEDTLEHTAAGRPKRTRKPAERQAAIDAERLLVEVAKEVQQQGKQ
jgi:hypothetical protein